MSDDQNRGRRRPSREYHSNEGGAHYRRPRERSISEEPVSSTEKHHRYICVYVFSACLPKRESNCLESTYNMYIFIT